MEVKNVYLDKIIHLYFMVSVFYDILSKAYCIARVYKCCRHIISKYENFKHKEFRKSCTHYPHLIN